MAFTAGFSVNVGDPTKATDVTTLAANDDFLKTAIDKIMVDSATPTFALVDGVTATTQSAGNDSTKLATTAYADAAGASLSGTTNDTVVTVTGANAMQGEANLTFDGSTLAVTGTATATSDITGLTLNATGDTAAADNAAMGYTSAEGLILTGQGSTSDVTIKNDADTTVMSIATGTTDVSITGNLDLTTTGNRIDFDTDNDTSIRASADDVLKFEAGGADVLSIHAAGGLITTAGGGIMLDNGDFGNGNAGRVIVVGRNTNSTNTGAGTVRLANKSGTYYYLWVDATGDLRIGTSIPTHANDTSGSVVGSQS